MTEISNPKFEFDELLKLKETPREFRPSLEIGGGSIKTLEILQDFINLIDGVTVSFSDDEKGFPAGQNFSIGIVTKYEMRKRGGEWDKKERRLNQKSTRRSKKIVTI